LTTVIQAGRDATSLGEWVRAFGHAATQTLRDLHRRSSWIEPEMHQLSADEHAAVHQQVLEFHRAITMEIARFVGDESTASRLAWILACAFGGYAQLFHSRGLERVSEFDPDSFVETMAWIFEKAAE
jgi:hypothetical protein